MSSEITAEGGTITLSTAPDGEITASSADFAVYVVQQVEGGGAGVTEYATLAELITASEGSLAEGYYTVAETPPVTHPLYPKIVTYWDGLAFEPQISTGFEARPYTSDEIFVWCGIEAKFRAKPVVGNYANRLKDLQSSIDLATASGQPFGTRIQDQDGYIAIDYGTADSDILVKTATGLSAARTIILAGNLSQSAFAAAEAIAGVGPSAAANGFAIFNVSGGVIKWNIGWWLGSDDSVVVPRGTTEDVAILTCNASGYRFWVNGTEILSRSGLTRDVEGEIKLGHARVPSPTYRSGATKVRFVRFSDELIDDTDAAAWTAWLQDRYGIPTL
jgi:hypothetical protein